MLKTVIGRFSEVKSLYTEGQLTGTDEEGEVVDVNKVQTALRAAGISMTEFLKGNEGLDQVFLRLSERWDDLDILTQRYIATQASGSRQQSRFLAIMSDYSKTMELVNAAYNSAGSGQRQFEKTLDSLQSKLMKLKNAWDEFTMGLANNEIIGVIVETLTDVLDIINKIIDGISGGNGLIKSVLTLLAVVGGLKLGGSIFDALLKTGTVQNLFKTLTGQVEKDKQTEAAFREKGMKAAKSFQEGFAQVKNKDTRGQFLKDKFFALPDETFGEFQKDIEKKINNLDFEVSSTPFEILNQQAKDGKIGIDEYKKAMEGVYGDSALAEEAGERLYKNLSQTENAFKRTGKTITEAGVAFMALGGIVSQFNPELGKVISTIGGVVSALGGIVQVIPNVISGLKAAAAALGTTVGVLGGWAVGIAVVISTIIAVVNAVKNASPEAQLDKATEATNKAKNAANEASQAYDDLLDKKKSITDMENGLQNLTKGSLEWKKAIVELNNEILNLKSNFPELEIGMDETTGALSIKNFDALLKTQMERVQNANANLALRTIDETNKQAEVDRQAITSDEKLSVQEKVGQRNSITQRAGFTNVSTLSSVLDETASDFATSLSEAMLREVTLTTQKTTMGGHQNSQKKIVEETTKYSSLLSKLQSQATKNIEKEYNTKDKRKAEYENRYGKDSAKDLSDDEIKQGLIDSSVGEMYRTIGDKISTLGDKGSDLVNILAGQLPQSLSEVIGSDLSIDNFWDENTGKTLAEALGISPEELKSRLQGSLQIAKDTVGEIETAFQKVGVGKDYYQDFSYSVAKSLSTQITQMSKESAEQYLSNFSKITDGLEESQKKQLQNYLSSVDLSDMVDVSNARDYMETLGIDKNKIAQFWGEANKYCKAYISSLEQVSTLNEKISNLGNARELVSEGQMSFSSDDKATLVAAGFAEEDFIKTGFDEWTYAVGDTNTLLEQIDAKVGVISNQIVGGLEEGINRGTEYAKVLDNEDNAQLKADLETLSQYGYGGTSFNEDDLRRMAEQLQIDTTNLNAEGIAQALVDALELYNNLGTNKAAAEQEQINAAALQYETNGDFGIYTNDLSDDQREKILQAQLNKNAGAQELYNKLVKESGDITGDFNQKLADEAIQITKTTQKYKEIAPSIDDYKEALIQGESAGTDFYSAINIAKKDLSQLFDIDSSLITDDFIKQYAQDIYNLAEGGEVGTAAFNTLNEALNQFRITSLKKQLEDAHVDVSNFENWINELEPTLTTKFLGDNSNLVGMFNQMIQDAGEVNSEVLSKLLPIITALERISNTNIGLEYEFDKSNYLLPNMASEKEAFSMGYAREGNSGAFYKIKRIKGINYSSNTTGGLGGLSLPDRSSSGSSGSDKKDSTWENPYDKLYNLTEQINEALRQREKLEREYDRILERRGSTFGELRKNYNSQLNSLKEEIRLQEQLRAGRLDQLNNLASETYKGQDSEGNELIKSFASWGVTKYANYNPNTGLLKIDWDAIDRVKDENTGGAIEAYISRLEELQTQIEDIDTQIEDFEDRMIELQKEGMQDYLDFEQKVYDAIVNEQQELIDNFQSLSNELADSNKEILDSIQESIDLQRQIRDNTKTEEDLNEKEARLAYLRRDTSNANLLEIKQLEDELADNRQDYEDSLIDQQLERLSKQNDDAQTAREKQIELMQAQLDYSEKNGEFWNQAYDYITTGFKANGDLDQASNLWNLLQKDEGWKGMSKFGQLNWQEEISKAILAASQGYANWNMYKAEKVDKALTTGDGKNLTFDGKNWKDSGGNIYNGVDFDSTKGQFTYSNMTAAQKPSTSGSGSSGSGGSTAPVGVGSRVRVDSSTPIYSDSYGRGGGRQYYSNDPIYNVIGENNGYFLVRHHKLGAGYTGWFKKSDVKAYKKGGLADFTGPAWLDGTKSNPELILNARDTENFIALKDILGSLMKDGTFKNSNATNSVGDMYFDIDINVDEIGSDYDVEQVSKKVKEDIKNDAMYRNVNLLNFIR